MLSRFFKYPVPFYAVALFFIVLAAAVFGWARIFRESIYPAVFQISSEKIPGTNFEYGSWPALSDANFFKSVHDILIRKGRQWAVYHQRI